MEIVIKYAKNKLCAKIEHFLFVNESEHLGFPSGFIGVLGFQQ